MEADLDHVMEVNLDHGAVNKTTERLAVDDTMEDQVAIVKLVKMGTTRAESAQKISTMVKLTEHGTTEEQKTPGS